MHWVSRLAVYYFIDSLIDNPQILNDAETGWKVKRTEKYVYFSSIYAGFTLLLEIFFKYEERI